MSIMDMREGPHLSSDFQSGVTRRQLLVQSKRKNLQEIVLLKGDNTDWLILGFDPSVRSSNVTEL